MAHYVIRYARNAGIVALFVVTAMLGVVSGVLFAYASDLPQISALDNYSPNTITRVYAASGDVIGEFAVQRRLVVGYDDIAPLLREAIISSEDADFNSHVGFSLSRIAVTAFRDIFEAVADKATGRTSRPAGASTLTQQLARNLFPDTVGFRVTPERKIKEAVVTIQIEKRYTKREILMLYANQVLFGHGTYGVEAAARLYFGKSAKGVSLEEAALLAGIIQSPARQSPYVNMDAAMSRRNYVLERMADEGYITRALAEETKRKPIVTHGQPTPPSGIAPFFVEEVRKHLERQYGAKTLYENGLSVTTTLDVRLQAEANRALAEGLRRLDKRTVQAPRAQRHLRGPDRRRLQGRTVGPSDQCRRHRPRDRRRDREAGAGRCRAASHRPVPGRPLEGRLRVDAPDERGGPVQARRSHRGSRREAGRGQPLRDARANAAGPGRDARDRKPNGSNQGDGGRLGFWQQQVQPGDPGVPTNGLHVQTHRLHDGHRPRLHTVVHHRRRAGQLPGRQRTGLHAAELRPKVRGAITLRRAIEDSRNIPAIKMMDTLGPKNVLAYAKRFGFQEDFPPYLPIALGAGDATLLEVTSAYTVFPNQGVRMTPFEILKVSDREGNLLEENRGEPVDVIRADTAFVMTNLLRGVVLRGTAAAAASIDWPIAGKTGTVDDNTDAWFIGFDPDITVGVWVGFDEKKSIGSMEQGAVAALPIWMDFMKAYIDAHLDKDNPPQFQAPGNIVFLNVDKANGAELPEGSPGAINEAFISGTQPGGFNRQP